MIAVALKGLAGRKVRALLTALAVVIGISMVSGTYILTDTMQKSFDGLFAATYEKTDAVISGKEIVKNSTTGSSARVPAALLAQVQDLPEVGEAGGLVTPDEANIADIIGKDGKKVARESVGASYDATHPQFTPLKLKSGAWPKGPQQIVVDAGTVAKQHYELGDAIKVSSARQEGHLRAVRHRQVRRRRLARVRQHRGLGPEDRADGAAPRGQLRPISISAAKGTSSKELVRAVQPLVPGALQVKDSDKQAKDDAQELDSSMSILKYFLLGFGAIALLVGAFVIFNTLSITVAQRTREFATLRTLGASRKQVMRSVIAEGLVIGLLASLIGLVVGIGLAKGMVALFTTLGFELPDASTIIAPRTIVLSILVGTVTTLVASILPAKRATRVPPIAAVREGSTLPPSRYAAHTPKAGVIVAGASLGAVLIALFAGGLSGVATAGLLGGGVLGLFLGMALLAPRLVAPLARIVGWPARRRGIAGELAGANAVRNPGRTASTAAALMIGLTLVTLVAVLASSLGAVRHLGDQEGGPRRLCDRRQGRPAVPRRRGRPPGAGERREERLARALRHGDRRRQGALRRRHRPDDDRALLQVPLGQGLRARARAARDLRRDREEGLRHGPPPDDRQVDPGHHALGRQAHARRARNPQPPGGAAGRRQHDPEGVRPARAPAEEQPHVPRRRLRRARQGAGRGFGDATFHTGSGYAADKAKEMAKVLSMLYVLLGFSVIVSLFGMVNTLVLSVFERTREIGMLRTIGMTRRQARQMIRHESIITALIGAALGLGVGTTLAWIVMAKWHLPLALPVNTLFVFTLIAVLAGVGAAVMPARRASRLNVLEALQYE